LSQAAETRETGTVSGPVLARVIELAELERWMEVLHPDAGDGTTAEALTPLVRALDCVTPSAFWATALSHTGTARLAWAADFTACPPIAAYDRVILTPAQGARPRTVLHGLKFLKPGGRLVAVMNADTGCIEDSAGYAVRHLIRDRSGWTEPAGNQIIAVIPGDAA
jgi:protein-L-isoaspartate O-methyltransferase